MNLSKQQALLTRSLKEYVAGSERLNLPELKYAVLLYEDQEGIVQGLFQTADNAALYANLFGPTQHRLDAIKTVISETVNAELRQIIAACKTEWAGLEWAENTAAERRVSLRNKIAAYRCTVHPATLLWFLSVLPWMDVQALDTIQTAKDERSFLSSIQQRAEEAMYNYVQRCLTQQGYFVAPTVVEEADEDDEDETCSCGDDCATCDICDERECDCNCARCEWCEGKYDPDNGPNCDCCQECGSDECGYCEECDRQECRCKCCETCHKYPCECCGECNSYPCECEVCPNCEEKISNCSCDVCEDCDCKPCECPPVVVSDTPEVLELVEI